MIWLILACNHGNDGPWTTDAALASTAGLDGGAALSAEGYERRRYAGPALSAVDTDGSGDLSPAELAVLLSAHDPLTFDQARPMGALTREKWSKPFAAPPLQRSMWELLAFLRAEVVAVDPAAALPDDDALKAAAATEDLYSEEVQAILTQLKAGHDAHGLTFPDGLIHEP